MKIAGGLRHISELRKPEPERSTPVVAPLVNFEIQPSTDEEKLNKTEKAFLEVLRRRGHEKIGIQDLTLKLADNCRYTPEFRVVWNSRLTIYEVKGGFIREDAWIKLKTAARLFPEFDFVMAQDVGTAKSREWIETPIKR